MKFSVKQTPFYLFRTALEYRKVTSFLGLQDYVYLRCLILAASPSSCLGSSPSSSTTPRTTRSRYSRLSLYYWYKRIYRNGKSATFYEKKCAKKKFLLCTWHRKITRNRFSTAGTIFRTKEDLKKIDINFLYPEWFISVILPTSDKWNQNIMMIVFRANA